MLIRIRSEARTVPAVLIPTTPEIKITMGDVAGLNYDDDAPVPVLGEYDDSEDNGEDSPEEGYADWDQDAFDNDEAYIAPPSPPPPVPQISALSQWHTSSLLPVFHRTREAYHSTIPETPSPYTTPIGVADWQSLVRDPLRPPTLPFLKSLSHDNILRGLRYNADLLKPGRDCELFFTRWLWALLVAIKPWEDLDEEGLVVIRNVGKKAAQVLSRLKAAGELERGGSAARAPPAEGEVRRPGRKSKDDRYDPYTPSANTLATLDMVVSVVGEVWRQRDLLVERITHALGEEWVEEVAEQQVLGRTQSGGPKMGDLGQQLTLSQAEVVDSAQSAPGDVLHHPPPTIGNNAIVNEASDISDGEIAE